MIGPMVKEGTIRSGSVSPEQITIDPAYIAHCQSCSWVTFGTMEVVLAAKNEHVENGVHLVIEYKEAKND